jgi:hypothetical protein
MKRDVVRKVKLAVAKPRNVFAVQARARRAGRHQTRNERQVGRHEMARQLIEGV